MQSFIQSLSLRSKIGLGIAIPIFVALITVLLLFFSIRVVSENYQLLAEVTLPTSLSLQELAYRASRVNSSLNELITDLSLSDESDEIEDNTREVEEIVENAQALVNELGRYSLLMEQQVLDDDAVFVNVAEIGREIVALAVSISSEVTLNVDDLVEIRESLEDLERDFVTQIERLIAVENIQLQRSKADVTDAVNTTLRIFFVLVVLTAIAALATLRFVYRAISQPLASLTHTAERLKAGDLDARSSLESYDELGQFALTFNTMAKALQEKIDEAQAARLRAERSDQVKSAFLASMSHELRTPLNAIINFTRFVADGDTGPVNEQQAELLNEVVTSARHLLSLINDVLDMSKIEAGSLNLFVEESVAVDVLLYQAISTGQAILADKPVELHVDIAPALPLISGDKQRILQIFLNIISNACKFTTSGEVRIRAEQVGDEIMISVSDTGPGIAPEDQSLVFEPFKQTTSGLRQAGGTGLGMPIARSLAEAHKGRLWLESTYGQGTTFHLTLPIKSDDLVPVFP